MNIQSTSGKSVSSVSRQVQKNKTIQTRPDTCSPSSPFPEGKMATVSSRDQFLKGPLPAPKALQITDPSLLEKDGIDWDSIERCCANTVTLDNADTLERSIDHIASVYIAAKHTIQNKYADQEDKLTENMKRLDSLLNQAKNRMTSSYKNTVGRFLDTTGNKGLGEAMGNSLPAAIDKKIQDMEAYGQKKNLFDKEKKLSYNMLELALQVGGLNAREGRETLNDKGAESPSEKGQNGYTIKDLQAAGFMAKAASKMNPQELLLMDDSQLGIHMAVRYMKMAQVLDRMGIDEELSSSLMVSFETFLDQYSGQRLSGQKNASAPFQYALKRYHSTKDISKALTQSAEKYLGDSYFSDFRNYGSNISMSMSTRYHWELRQFMTALENGSTPDLMASVAGTGTHFTASFYA